MVTYAESAFAYSGVALVIIIVLNRLMWAGGKLGRRIFRR